MDKQSICSNEHHLINNPQGLAKQNYYPDTEDIIGQLVEKRIGEITAGQSDLYDFFKTAICRKKYRRNYSRQVSLIYMTPSIQGREDNSQN